MGDQKVVDDGGKDLEKDAPFPLTDVDKWVLSQTDEEWHFHDWNDLKETIGEQQATPFPFCFATSVQFLLRFFFLKLT
jgi:hypothetical protein